MPQDEPTTPHEEPAMPDEHVTIDDAPKQDTAVQTQPVTVQAPGTAAYEPAEEEWLEDPPGSELPPRPRRRLLTPVPLALMGVLAIACGFIGGVLVEKGQNSSSSSGAGASGLASRFAALRAGATGTAGASGTSGTGTRSGAGSETGGFGGGAGAAGFKRPTAGTVAYLDGDTLYVTNAEGNTIKVTTSAGTTVNKTVKSSVKGIHPGETVTITGETGSGGSVSAESINVGAGGGLAALFGGSGARGGFGSRSRGGGGEPALFGG
jgi:hypothetical protein